MAPFPYPCVACASSCLAGSVVVDAASGRGVRARPDLTRHGCDFLVAAGGLLASAARRFAENGIGGERVCAFGVVHQFIGLVVIASGLGAQCGLRQGARGVMLVVLAIERLCVLRIGHDDRLLVQ